MRAASLDVIAVLYSESDCKWSEDEYSVSIQTIGCFDLGFIDDFNEAVQEWVAENVDKLKNERTYQLIMKHVYEHDGAGACHSRYFDIIDVSYQDW